MANSTAPWNGEIPLPPPTRTSPTPSANLNGFSSPVPSLNSRNNPLHFAPPLFRGRTAGRSGNIRRLSTPAAELAQTNFKDLEGTSFFAKFTAGPSKGELIQKFLQTADSRAPIEKFTLTLSPNPTPSPSPTTLQLSMDTQILPKTSPAPAPPSSGRLLDASFVPVQTREGPGILVVLSESVA